MGVQDMRISAKGGRVAVQPVATLPLFHTAFGSGVVLGTPERAGSDTNWRTFVTGTDAVTGHTLPDTLEDFLGAGTLVKIQSIPETGNGIADDANAQTNFADRFTNQIQSTTSTYKESGNELLLQCDYRHDTGTNNPQTDLLIDRTAASALSIPFEEWYIRTDFYVPAGLNTQTGDTSTGKFFLFSDIKTGGYDDNYGVGDFRYTVAINGDSGTDKYEVRFDSEANGRGIIPGLSTGGIPISEGGSALAKETYMQIASEETVRTGCWHTLHIYTKRPANYLDTTTGIHQVVIEPHGYDPIELCNIRGGGYQAMGVENLPVTRLLVCLNYTSAILPNPIAIANLEIGERPQRPLI
jgi:hypothetical protein